MGLRPPPIMEGEVQVGYGVELGALQKPEPRAPPLPLNPLPLVTQLNGDQVHAVRAELSPVVTTVKDSPEGHHHHLLAAPSPLSLPYQGNISFQDQPRVAPRLHQGNSNKSQGPFKGYHINPQVMDTASSSLGTGNVHFQ